MNITVCIKQVPGSTKVKVDPDTGTLMRDSVEAIVNPFDEYAIEEALRIKERQAEGTVSVLTMGPPQAEEALKTAIAMGADHGYLVSDRKFAGSDTWATSYTLAASIRTMPHPDLIICGKQAIDGDTAQVGPGVAEMLDIPFVAYVRKIEEISDSSIKVERMVEEGYDVVEMPLPGVITVVKEINAPRMISLKGKMKAKKAVINKITADDLDVDEKYLGLSGSPTEVYRSFVPEKKTGGEKVTGEVPELVTKAKETLKGLGIV